MKPKRIIITAGAKGGAGKSLTSSLIHSWVQSKGREIVSFDGDPENSTLSRFVPEARFIDMREPSALDQILVPIESEEADVVLLDSRAATSEEMLHWFRQIGIEAIHTDLNAALTVVSFVTHSRDTLEQLKWWTDELGRGVDWLVVRNLVGGQVEEYDQSRLRKKLLSELKAHEFTLPSIPAYLVKEWESKNLTISAACTSGNVTWANRRRFIAIRDRIFSDLDLVETIILP